MTSALQSVYNEIHLRTCKSMHAASAWLPAWTLGLGKMETIWGKYTDANVLKSRISKTDIQS